MLSSISAVTICNPSISGGCPAEPLISPIITGGNYSITTNNSNCWMGHCTNDAGWLIGYIEGDALSLHLNQDNWNLGTNWLTWDSPTLDFNGTKLNETIYSLINLNNYWNQTSNSLFPSNLSKNVGIGTDTPNGKLEVKDTNTTILIISSGTGNENASLDFREANVPRARIEYGGANGLLKIWSLYADGMEDVIMSFDTRTNNVNIPSGNLTINGSIEFKERTGIQNLFFVNPYDGDGFRMEYRYDFEMINDDWLVFRKTDGNDERPDGGIAFMMSNASGWNKTIIKFDGYGNSNFTDQNITTTGKITSNGLNINGNVNITNNLDIGGNVSFKRPYGIFSSTQAQVMSIANTPYPITFNWTEDNYLVYKSNDNINFSFGQTGDYNIILSPIFLTNSNNRHVEIWVQKNGVNIPRSNTRARIENAGIEFLLPVSFIIDMNTTDRFRVMMASSDTGAILQYTTNTSYSPESPSIIMTMNKISEITV
jgi:hypothetical protein